MQPACDHARTQMIARRDGVDYVECLDCRQIFEAEDLEPLKAEEEEEWHSACALAWRAMHDLSFFRNDFDRIAARLATRGNAPALDRFRDLDLKRRAVIREAELEKALVN